MKISFSRVPLVVAAVPMAALVLTGTAVSSGSAGASNLSHRPGASAAGSLTTTGCSYCRRFGQGP
jgi:hypothetical protein